MFRKKSLRKLVVFRIVLQNKGEKRVFLGEWQEKGESSSKGTDGLHLSL